MRRRRRVPIQEHKTVGPGEALDAYHAVDTRSEQKGDEFRRCQTTAASQ